MLAQLRTKLHPTEGASQPDGGHRQFSLAGEIKDEEVYFPEARKANRP